jgi:hypothetical protein
LVVEQIVELVELVEAGFGNSWEEEHWDWRRVVTMREREDFTKIATTPNKYKV